VIPIGELSLEDILTTRSKICGEFIRIQTISKLANFSNLQNRVYDLETVTENKLSSIGATRFQIGITPV